MVRDPARTNLSHSINFFVLGKLLLFLTSWIEFRRFVFYLVLSCRHESQFIGDIVEEVGKRLDSTVLLAPYIAWHRYRLLVKKTKMIVYILYIICISIFVGLFLYKFICTWIFLQSEFDRHLKGDQYDRVIWKIGNGPSRAGTEQDFVRELLRSTGTKKNIDMGIKIMCSLVLAFCLS